MEPSGQKRKTVIGPWSLAKKLGASKNISPGSSKLEAKSQELEA
jgi:hypothetical protein